jgi:hypothetical protein
MFRVCWGLMAHICYFDGKSTEPFETRGIAVNWILGNDFPHFLFPSRASLMGIAISTAAALLLGRICSGGGHATKSRFISGYVFGDSYCIIIPVLMVLLA